MVAERFGTLPRVAGERGLHVLAYNPTRVMNIIGIKPLVAAIMGQSGRHHARSRALTGPAWHSSERPGVV